MSNLSPHSQASVVAGGGFLTGLAGIFLPMTQSLPSTVSSGTVHDAVLMGFVAVVASVLGKLVHHGFLTSKQAASIGAEVNAKAPAILDAVAKQPVVEQVVNSVRNDLASLQDRVKAFETDHQAIVPEVNAFEAAVKAEVEKRLAAAAPAADPTPAAS